MKERRTVNIGIMAYIRNINFRVNAPLPVSLTFTKYPQEPISWYHGDSKHKHAMSVNIVSCNNELTPSDQ